MPVELTPGILYGFDMFYWQSFEPLLLTFVSVSEPLVPEVLFVFNGNETSRLVVLGILDCLNDSNIVNSI